MIRKAFLLLILGWASDADAALVARWKLDDNAASTTVVATVGSNGTLVNAGNTSASTTTGPGAPYTAALLFDGNKVGTGDHVTVSSFTIPTTGSCTFWANPTLAYNSSTTDYPIYGGDATNGQMSWLHFNNNSIYIGWFRSGTDDRISMAASASNQSQSWQHYAVVWTSGGGSVAYRNGASLGTDASTTTTSNAGTFYIASGSGGVNNFGGAMADVRVYDNALTQAEVLALYEEVFPPQAQMILLLQ